LRAVPLVIFALVVAGSVVAQNDPPAPPNPSQQEQQNPSQADPPGRVARLDYMSGEVSLQPGGVNDWVAGEMNRPLSSSDRVWTDKNSRAELSLGTASIRMNSETSLTLTTVADNSLRLELDQGVLNLSVLRMMPGEVYQVNMPNATFTVSKPGDYRFDVIPSHDESWVTVRHGGGEVSGKGTPLTVHEGEQARFSGEGQLEGNVGTAPNRDAFDQWALERDRRVTDSQSARRVAPGTIGAEDLDSYGTWQDTHDYGAVWRPTVVASDWAPYRNGHWVWIDPWGWTWVDDEPWGFAPFHYGRWVYYDDYWAWAPGPIYVGMRPIWAPALVGWYGDWGWGFGGVGWFPLGWGEPFYPWYHCGHHYFHDVNWYGTRFHHWGHFEHNYWGGHFEHDHFMHQQRGFSAMSHNAFAGSRSVRGNMLHVDAAHFNGGHVLARPGVNPTHTSYLGMSAGRHTSLPPNGAFTRHSNVTSVRGGFTNNGANGGFTAHNPGNFSAMHTVPRPSGSASTFSAIHGNASTFSGTHNGGNTTYMAHGSNGTLMAHAGNYTVPRPPQNFHPQMNYGGGFAHNSGNLSSGNLNHGSGGYSGSYNHGSNVYNNGHTYSAGPANSAHSYSNGGGYNSHVYNNGGSYSAPNSGYSSHVYNGGHAYSSGSSGASTYSGHVYNNGGNYSSHVYNGGGGYSSHAYNNGGNYSSHVYNGGGNNSSHSSGSYSSHAYSGGGGSYHSGGGGSSHNSGGGSSSGGGHSSSGGHSHR